MGFADLPEIGAAPSLQTYHDEVVKPGIQMLMMQMKALAAKVDELSKETRPIIVEVKVPENLTLTIQRRDIL